MSTDYSNFRRKASGVLNLFKNAWIRQRLKNVRNGKNNRSVTKNGSRKIVTKLAKYVIKTLVPPNTTVKKYFEWNFFYKISIFEFDRS